MPTNISNRLVRLPEVCDITGSKRSTIYLWMKRNQFPRPINIGPRSVAWPESVINEWIEARIAEGKQES